jgi:tetratricopeptide (TPR) repeat protein
MERKKYKLIILFLLLVSADLYADYRSEIYYAYVNNRMEQWKNVIDRMEALKGKSNDLTLELINYQYGYIGYCMGVDKKDEAKKYFDLAIKNIEILDKAGYKISVINAYKSAFYGFRIGFNKISAPFNGPKSIDHAKRALEQDSDNYLAYVQYGNAQFYMPAAFGGSKKEAMEYFLKAKAILEKNPEETKGNWNYLNVMTLIGQAYTALEDYNAARTIYESTLKFEPGFTYVRDELYPGLKKKMDKK